MVGAARRLRVGGSRELSGTVPLAQPVHPGTATFAWTRAEDVELGHVDLVGAAVTESSLALTILVSAFLVLESANVAALYFAPGSTRFNAVGVFAGWTDSTANADLHEFVRYLVFWVAGTKVIFIALWLVILLVGEPRTQLLASIVMVPAIATFYWRLFPIVRRLDSRGLVHPSGYSTVLGAMIAGFIVAFVVAIAVAV